MNRLREMYALTSEGVEFPIGVGRLAGRQRDGNVTNKGFAAEDLLTFHQDPGDAILAEATRVVETSSAFDIAGPGPS